MDGVGFFATKVGLENDGFLMETLGVYYIIYFVKKISQLCFVYGIIL